MHDQRHQPSESIAKCDWVAPAFLTEGAFAGFDTLIHQAVVQQRPLHLDWRDVSSVDPNYWGVIKIQLNAIAAQKIHCVMYGVPALRQCVDTALPSALLAALALLRCLNEFEAFETLALEYSRVSEISPPDWLGPLCRLELKDGPLTAQLECDGEPQSQSQRQMMRQVHTEESGEHVFALIGEIDQLPADWLGRDPPFSRIERWPVQCDKLVRIGVSATQQLATQLQSLGLQGIRFEFCNVHRLIAALFLQEGLYDIAKIMTRKD
jgi:anti-anti-sigma regulatory factor